MDISNEAKLLIRANKKLLDQSIENEMRAVELKILNKQLKFQNLEKEARAAELLIANKTLAYENREKEARAAELVLANKELLFQNEEKVRRAEEHSLTIDKLMLRNRDLEQFSYVISHNLRAHVANIIGASNTLIDQDLCKEDTTLVIKGINFSVLKLDGIIKDLIQIIHLKAAIEPSKEHFKLSEITAEVVADWAAYIAHENFSLTFDFSKVDSLFSNRTSFKDIINNLLSNSIKYRNKEIKTIVEVESSMDEKTIEICFKDNGKGIDLLKYGEKVFGMYKKFHGHIDGKGMGLYLVKLQVEALGGHIFITSAVDIGTEFKMVFELSDFTAAQ